MKAKGFILIFFLLSLSLTAQKENIFHRNLIGLNITELPFVDFRFSYERRLSVKNAIKVEAGFKPSWKLVRDMQQFEPSESATAWLYGNTAQWYFLGTGYKFFFGKSKRAFLSADLFYKLIHSGKIVYIVSHSSSSINYSVRQVNANVFSFSLCLGKRVELESEENTTIGFDFFAGIGFRYKYVRETVYGRAISTSGFDSPHTIAIPLSGPSIDYLNRYLQPSILFGVVFFIGWN